MHTFNLPKRHILYGLIIFLMVPAIIYAQDKSSADKKVAEVNGTVITQLDFNREMTNIQSRVKQSGQPISDEQLNAMRKKTLDNLIDEEILYQQSQKKGINVDPPKIQAQIDAFKKKYPSEAKYQEALKSMQATEASIRTKVKRRLAIQRLIFTEIVDHISITEKESQDFYTQHPEYFNQPERVRASHILIKVAPEADASAKQKAEEKIKDIQQKIKTGSDFAALAKEFSEGPSGPKGGDLGYFPRGKMVKPFEDAAFAMQVGDVSDTVKTRFGFHLIKLTDRKKAETISFEDSKAKIDDYLKKQKANAEIDQYIIKLRENAKVQRYM